jgi:glycosyltransferase involved in cell wall biosynthesis
LIIDLVDVESVLLSRQGRGVTKPLFARFASVCARMERELLRRFDGVMVTSAADARYVDVPSIVYPNTIPLVPLPRVAKGDCIAFSGNMEYEPNRTGIRWFYREVWPRLRPRVKWKLIGRNEHAVLPMIAGNPRITLTGPVQDAVTELAACRVAVVPLLAGSGTRVKIVEAWAAGLPVVSTTIGAEGLPPGPTLIADAPEDFARAIECLLDDPERGCRLGMAGRRLYEERLTWQAAWGTLKDWGL